jgi:hypothetical protein
VTAREFEDLVAKQLKAAGLKFEREPAVGGLRPDFLVVGPQGQHVVVEAKAWDPRGGNTARALEQAERYQSATGADKAFVVLPELQRSFTAKGVVGMDGFVEAVKAFLAEPRTRSKRQSWQKPARDRSVFAAMPFEREYDDTFFVAMSYAAARVGAACTRVDRHEFSGDIVDKIKRLIRSSIAVIVDLSEAKPNVLYEAGYAHALDKPAVHICSTPLAALPFDVRNWNTLAYSRGQTTDLRETLARRLNATLH